MDNDNTRALSFLSQGSYCVISDMCKSGVNKDDDGDDPSIKIISDGIGRT